ncbi:MAG: hypothetical protein KDA20_05390 [Phycisphaerales bacterium]|nr:hypothetical protein [Phycisphaerales bacterium]
METPIVRIITDICGALEQHRRIDFGCGAVVVGLLFASSLSIAQVSNIATVRLPPQVSLPDLVELAAREANLSLNYDAQQLRGQVTFRLDGPVTPDELWSITTSVLDSRDFVVVESAVDSLYEIVPLQSATKALSRIEQPAADMAAGLDSHASFGSVVFPLQSGEAESVIAAIKPILSANVGQARAIGDGSLLLLTDTSRRLQMIKDLLPLVDRADDTAEGFFLELDNIQANQAASILGTIAASGTGGALRKPDDLPRFVAMPTGNMLWVVARRAQVEEITELARSIDQAEELEVRTYAPPRGVAPRELAEAISQVLELASTNSTGTADQRTRVATQQLTGSVVVRATGSQHLKIEAIVESIAAAPADARQELRTFAIRNRDAAELAATLSQLMDFEVFDASAQELEDQAGQGAGRAPTPPSTPNPDKPLSLTVDSATNSLLAVGNAFAIRQLEPLIEDLDRRQPQVMLEITLVSINEGRTLDLGVELDGMWRNGRTVTNLASLFGLGSGTGGTSAGTGFTGNVMQAGDFEALVRAVESTNAGRAVSMPRLLADNNQPSTLRSVNREPFTAINASDTVATTSFAGNEDAGTTITITPQIAAGDHLTLEYSLELSAFTGDSQTLQGGGVIPPPSQENTLQGKVTIPDSFTVAIGGLRSVNTGDGRTQVPVLGSLPLIGALFGSTSETQSEARFYVFLRGTILRDASFAGLRHLSARELAEAQVDDGSPRVQPVWIE